MDGVTPDKLAAEYLCTETSLNVDKLEQSETFQETPRRHANLGATRTYKIKRVQKQGVRTTRHAADTICLSPLIHLRPIRQEVVTLSKVTSTPARVVRETLALMKMVVVAPIARASTNAFH